MSGKLINISQILSLVARVRDKGISSILKDVFNLLANFEDLRSDCGSQPNKIIASMTGQLVYTRVVAENFTRARGLAPADPEDSQGLTG